MTGLSKRLLLSFLCFFGIFLGATRTSLAGSTGFVTITQMGCGLAGTVCFLDFSGPPPGPAGCDTLSEFRWDIATSPNGKAALAQLTAAFISGKQVLFYTAVSCFSEQPAYATIDTWVLGN